MQIHIRHAVYEDADMILAWRNAPETRRYSFETGMINRDVHFDWFKKTIASDERYLLIAELEDEPIGVLRFDIVDMTTAEVSIYLSPIMLGKGLGARVLSCGAQWVENNLPGIKKLRAKVIPENIASVKVFEKAGYSKVYTIYEKIINH